MTLPEIRKPLAWNAEALWQRLEAELPGLSIEVLARTPSTNSTLLERVRVRGADEFEGEGREASVRRSVESGAFGRRASDVQPCLLVAEHQTGGRGRQGRVWKSVAGASLTLSLALPLARDDWSGLSLAVGVALADALDPAGAAQAPRIGLKWPNDLWLLDAPGAGRKLGGILVETVTAGGKRMAVIGVGINVLPIDVPDASDGVACLQELEPQTSAPAALESVALPLVLALKQFDREGFAPFVARYAHRDLLQGHAVRTTHVQAARGVARGVAENGALQVQTDTGMVLVSSGEVSVRPAAAGTSGDAC